jgi:hypothetical protein
MKTLIEWITENNVDSISSKKNYSKGWWDYIDIIRILEGKFNFQPFVVSSYNITTPPPSEELTLPLVLCRFDNFDAYIMENFSYSGFYDTWLVSIKTISDKNLDISNFINPIILDRKDYKEGFIESSISDFKSQGIFYHNFIKNEKEFTGTVESEYDLYALLKKIKSDLK